MSNPEFLREIIKKKLEEKGLSVSKVEKMAGLGPTSLRNFLIGKTNNPKFETLIAVTNTLKLDLLKLDKSSVDEVSTQTYQIAWDKKLFIEIADTLSNFIISQKIKMPSIEAITIIQEFYYHCLSEEIKNPKESFSNWILKKLLKKNYKN